MSSASTYSVSASNGTCQDKIAVNGIMHHSINAVVHCCVSQQVSNNKARGALIDGGASDGLLGEDVHILEHTTNGFVNITGVAGDEVANLQLAQATAFVETMADGPIVVIMSQCTNFGAGQQSIPKVRWNTLV